MAGGDAEAWHLSIAPWQSITFTGERHAMLLKVPLGGDDALLSEALCDADVPGSVVADVVVEEILCRRDHRWLSIEMLTLFEDEPRCGSVH